MKFNKKRLFLYSSILLLILVGVYFVNSSGFINRIPLLSTGFVTTNTSVVTFNGNQTSTGFVGEFKYTELANWTRGGTIELFNFTLQMSSIVTNISEINVTMPSGGYSNITIYGGTSNTSNQYGLLGGNWTLSRVYNDVESTYITTFRAINATNGAGGNGNLTAGQNISVWFNAIAVNGTEVVYNWTVTVRNTSIADSGLGSLMGIDGLPPRGNTTNVTDTTNLITSFSGTKYLRYDAASANNGINITLTVNDYNMDRVLLVYNSTGGSINFVALRNLLYNTSFLNSGANGLNGTLGVGGPQTYANFTALEANNNSAKTNSNALDTRSDVRLTSASGYVFRFNISNATWGLGAADGTTFKYVFVVYDLYNHSEIINNSNAEYVLARDVASPTATLTAPGDTSIGLFDPIKYTCGGSDTSGLASCTTTVTKPGAGSTVTKTGCST